MSDLIKREDAIKATWQEPTYTDPLNVLTEVRDRIEAIPSADRRQGSWESWWNGDLNLSRWGARCTSCHKWSSAYFDYCPNCGADMRGDNDGKAVQSADE